MIYELIVTPILLILRWTLIPWIPKARERVHYEKRARHFKGARSFKLDSIQADLAFEFSSEGEFQQCLPLIEGSLLEGKNIELIYFSPSVEKGVHGLYEKYPNQIRVLNFPLLTTGFSNWISAKKLILVRYDFFPEILFWARVPGNELSIIWVSFKKKRLRSKKLSGYQLLFLKNAKNLICATVSDQEYLKNHGIKADTVYDFRIVQILKRLKNSELTLTNKFPGWNEFKNFLAEFHSSDRVLLGNAWPVDLKLMSDDFSDLIEDKKKILVIVPHLVGGDHVKNWKDKIQELNLTSLEIHPDTNINDLISSFHKTPSVIVIHLKGVLCELYGHFSYSYVGGGFGASVHSLLEPYISGSQFVASGPKVERSTEIDLSNQDYPVVSILNGQSDFSQWSSLKSGDNLIDRQKKLENYYSSFDDVRKRF